MNGTGFSKRWNQGEVGMTFLSMLLSLICFIILELIIALQQGQDTAGHAAAGAGGPVQDFHRLENNGMGSNARI